METNKKNGQLPFEFIFRTCTTFKHGTKGLSLHITVRGPDLQDIGYTTIANDFVVTIEKLFLFVSIYTNDPQTQVTLSESIKNILINCLIFGLLIEKLLLKDYHIKSK